MKVDSENNKALAFVDADGSFHVKTTEAANATGISLREIRSLECSLSYLFEDCDDRKELARFLREYSDACVAFLDQPLEDAEPR